MFLGLEALVFHLIQGHISDLLHLLAASLTWHEDCLPGHPRVQIWSSYPGKWVGEKRHQGYGGLTLVQNSLGENWESDVNVCLSWSWPRRYRAALPDRMDLFRVVTQGWVMAPTGMWEIGNWGGSR